MRLQLVVILMIVVIVGFTDGQYPDCVSCADGSIPLSPSSYMTMRSNAFNGTQLSNTGCTHDPDGGVTTNCEQGSTLVDCDQGFNGGDYSDLSNSFIWNNISRQQVSIEFTFDQQISINNISMFFWNSPSNSIIVPDVRMYWKDYTDLTSFRNMSITTNSPSRTKNGECILNIDTRQLKFQYLRIDMSFYDDSKWIFLGEVQFCGNVPPFHITQPSTDNTVRFVSPNATISVTCSLNITMPSIVQWIHNDDLLSSSTADITTAAKATTLKIENFKPSDVGVYRCLFSSSGWTLTRNIRLVINTNHTTYSGVVITTATSTTSTAIAAIDSTATAVATTTTTTAIAASNIAVVSPTNTTNTSTGANASDDSTNVVVIIVPIIVIILLLIAVVIVLVLIFIWRKRQMKYRVSNDGTKQYSQHCDDQSEEKKKPEKKEKKKALELQKKGSEFTQSGASSTDTGAVEFDLYANVHEVNRSAKENPISIHEDNLLYEEAINPAAIVNGLSHYYSSVADDPCPYGSIYADPLPLVKSERPPIVSNKNIKQLHPLGIGQFGEVVLAKTVGLSFRYLGIGKSNDTTISIKVAVKTLKSAITDETRKLFEKEIKFMSRLKNDNVVRLLGICTTGTPFIMMEYMEHGDLNHYLQKFKFTYEAKKLPAANEITLNALVYMSFQIASGMEYLSSLKFIHRDLAARNVLVGVNFTVKVADFGMSRNMYEASYCKITGRNILPIRWMAHECFFGKFSIQTDVWSFGITLWEIFTLCRKLPFDEFSDKEMIEDAIKGANRRIVDQPSICPNEVYGIMESCLQHEPSERPRFNVLCDQLNEFYNKIQ